MVTNHFNKSFTFSKLLQITWLEKFSIFLQIICKPLRNELLEKCVKGKEKYMYLKNVYVLLVNQCNETLKSLENS